VCRKNRQGRCSTEVFDRYQRSVLAGPGAVEVSIDLD
jgi:hypothetical protein